ncbi:MAG: alginate lyase family protein [Bacteroides sp.]|nr:alginate lyase family protein [Roseburia sp.]MCM1346256.1 alginate lyase family protein [Bacteroides sp.]MCM1420829.1 alginate lyase family protein [Bacteroides sp.]
MENLKNQFSPLVKGWLATMSVTIRLVIVFIFLMVVSGVYARKFVHPGILTGSQDIERMCRQIANKEYPAYGSFVLLRGHHCSKSDYQPFGPFEVIARDGEFRYTKSKMEQDFCAAYQNALMWVLTGDKAHAEKSIDLLLGYARTLKNIPDTNDAPLLAGIEGFKIAYAAEILHCTYNGMTDSQFKEICEMLKNVFVPVMEAFFNRKAYTNGNWGPIVTKAYMAAAILFDNKKMYNKAVDFYLHANDNGTIAHYISGETGQIQESGRDQGHCMLGIGAMATVCEMAWLQGDDLYGALDNRLMKGFEYVARYNLGEDVPFTQWKDVTGKYDNWSVISSIGRGQYKPVFEMVYNHFVVRKGLQMPYTERVLRLTRPEGFDRDEASFGSLLFYEGKAEETTVHAYAPFTVPASGVAGAYPSHVRNDVLSSRFDVRVAETDVAAVRYDNTGFGNQGHNVDVARFASNSITPMVEISLKEGSDIHDVTIHPVCFYPQDAIFVSADRRTLRFEMNERLSYAIVAINGGDPQDASDSNPQLVLINDPLEKTEKIPNPTDNNVLDFKSFSEDYLRNNPNTDNIGDRCRQAGSVTDASMNDGRQFIWNYDEGKYVAYTDKAVAFPNKRARNGNDLSDALQAALMKIKDTPELNTLYIGPGIYLWSGLRIFDWNGDIATGGKPLYIYTDENALMINRLKECRESLEPAIFIKNSSFVTISGRGMHDAQGCYTFSTDRKDARNTPHQGGVVVMKSNNITFNDTYMRDSQQWNWETHSVRDVVYNNIKGLSPYNHGWIDGLNFSSGKNITVNNSLTLGNDDTFATGHYNPSDEFPVRTYNENKNINIENTDANPAEIRHTFAAAAIYNGDRLTWSTYDSENIRVNNAMGWTRTAHCIRAGSNLSGGKPWVGDKGVSLKSYYFNNFHSVAGRKAEGMIRFQNGHYPDWPSYDNIVIENCSFWTSASKWLLLTSAENNKHMIKNVALRNLFFVNPVTNPVPEVSGVENLTIEKLYFGGKRVTSLQTAGFPEHFERVGTFSNDFK